MLAAYLHGEDLISQNRAGKASYYHYDGLGSTRALTDSTGAVTDAYTYAAYGQVLEQSGETENNYLYTGEQYDTALDSYYLRARYYSAASKRFLSMDSFAGVNENPVTLNKYLYGNVNPINYIDPTGMSGTLTEFGASTGVLGVFAVSAIGTGYFQFSNTPTGFTDRDIGIFVLATMGGVTGLQLYNIAASSDEHVTPAEKEDAEIDGETQALVSAKTANHKNAAIGETQKRVRRAAIKLKAITIHYIRKHQYETPLSPRNEALSLAYNAGWIEMIMALDFNILDIGRDPVRIAAGEEISLWYSLELSHIKARGYPKYYRINKIK